ncbi:MAG: hypothetical protein NC416_03650 [Eubacterium sp.]|nr:hypothetical protein [Eubacterium sp.]
MVNRINGNDYHDYSQLKMPDAADKTGNGEKFSLNYQRAEEEDKDKKDKTEDGKEANVGNASPNGKSTVMQGGVRLELSANAQAVSDRKRESTAQTAPAGARLLDAVRSWISTFVQSVKTFLYKIWNDDTAQNAAVEEAEGGQNPDGVQGAESAQTVGVTESPEEPERLTEEYLELKKLESLMNPEAAARERLQREADRDKEIQKYLKSGNLEQVISLLTQNGQKTMAKNSTLLTYYDRTGKITPISASDQERILHGDRNVKKL